MADTTTTTTTTTTQEKADRLLCLTEDLKNELFDLYISCPTAAAAADNLPLLDSSNLLLQIAKELYEMCRSYNNSDLLVKMGALTLQQVNDAKMYLLFTKLLSHSGGGDSCTTTTTYASLVASVRKALVLATNQGSSLVMELLLDPNAVAQQLNHSNESSTGGRLLDLPQRRHDENGYPYVTGGLFDLQESVKAMRRCRVVVDDDGGGTHRPKKRQRLDTNNDIDIQHHHETSYAQLSLAYILVTMVCDICLQNTNNNTRQEQQEQQQPALLTVEMFLQEIHLLGMFSPVLKNAFFATNAPVWVLLDHVVLLNLPSSTSSNNNINIPTDLTLAFIQRELCNIHSSAISVLTKASSGSGGVVSDYAILARCGEIVMAIRDDDDDDDIDDNRKHAAVQELCSAIKSKLFFGWRRYVKKLALKKQKKSRVLGTSAADASSGSPTTTGRRRGTIHLAGTKRPMQDSNNNNNNNSSSHDIDDPTLSLWEKLAKPEYPLFILVKLLLMQRQLDAAILIVVTMEKEDILDFPVLYQAYKLLFQFFLDDNDGRLLFDRSRDVPAVQSLYFTFFPLVGRNGIRILAHLHCGLLERIRFLQAPGCAATPEQAFVSHSCVRALLRMLGSQYTLQEGLKHYEELRRDQGFAAVLEGPMSLDRARQICQNECQLPDSGIPDLAALLRGPEEPVEQQDVIAPDVVDDAHHVAAEMALPSIVAEAVAPPPVAAAAIVHALETDEEEEFYDAQQHQQDDEEDQGYDAAEESQGEPQPEDMAMVDSTPLVQQPRQEETTMLAPPSRPRLGGDDDDGYVPTGEESQDQDGAKHVNVAPRIPRREFDDGYEAEESQGPDDVAQPPPTRKRVDYDADDSQDQTEDEEDLAIRPTVPLKERNPEAISTEVVQPDVAAASVQQPVAPRPDDSMVNQDNGYDGEESQGHSDEEDVGRRIKLHHAASRQQPDNGYDGEESQAGHMTEDGSVEFESTTTGQEPAAAVDRKHVAFAPVVLPAAAQQPEEDPGCLPSDRDDHTEDEVARVRTERDGYQAGESSVQYSENEEEVSEAMPGTEEEDDAALHGQEDDADKSPVREPSQPSAGHSSSDMDAADEHTMDREEDVAHESSDLDDDDDGDDTPRFPPSAPGGIARRSTLHDYAAAAAAEYSPANRHVRADSGQQVAPTPASRASSRDDIIILDGSDSSSEGTESENSSASAPPESSSQPHADYDEETDEQVVDEEEEMDSSAHSSPSPARKPSAYGEDYEHEEDSLTYNYHSPSQSNRGAQGEEDQQEGDGSTYSSPSPQGRARSAYGEEDQHEADSSSYSTPSPARKQPAEEKSLPTNEKAASADEVANIGPTQDVEMAEDETREVPLADTGAGTESNVDVSGAVEDAGVETADKSTDIIDIADSPSEDADMVDDDSLGDTGTGTANVNRDSVAVHEAGEPSADTTMDDAVAETVNDGAPENEEIVDKTGDGPLPDASTGTAGANTNSMAGGDKEVGEKQPQEETVDVVIENADVVQHAPEVVELLDDDSSDNAEMVNAGDVPLEESGAGTGDASQVSAADEDADAKQQPQQATSDSIIENPSDTVHMSEDGVELDDDVEMAKKGGESGAASDENQDSAAAPGAANEDAGSAEIQREAAVATTIEETIARESNKDEQPAAEDDAKPVGHAGVDPAASASGIKDDEDDEPVDTSSVDAKAEAITGKEINGGDVAESAPPGDIEDRNGNETADAATMVTQAEGATSEVKDVDDVTKDQPQSTLTDDSNAHADASTGGKEEVKQAAGDEEVMEGEVDDAAVQSVGMLTNPLTSISEQEVVDDIAGHDIREISTLNATVVNEGLGEHAHGEEGEDDDASAAAAGSDDENGSRRSRSTRGSVGKKKMHQSPARETRGGSIQTRSASKMKILASPARNTRSSAKMSLGNTSDGESGSVTRKTRAGSKTKSKSDDDGGTVASSSPKKRRGDVGDDDSVSITSQKRSKKKPGNASDDGGGSIASSNTRTRGKAGSTAKRAPTPSKSSKKPPRPPPKK